MTLFLAVKGCGNRIAYLISLNSYFLLVTFAIYSFYKRTLLGV